MTFTCCARCGHETLDKLADSPVPGVWEVYQCRQCLYTWRSTEPGRRTRRELYPEEFRMTAEDIANAIEVPAVPALRVAG